eukprot:12405055-Karenia_brevis.AAC.1
MSRVREGPDGIIAYERRTGEKWKQYKVQFGERCFSGQYHLKTQHKAADFKTEFDTKQCLKAHPYTVGPQKKRGNKRKTFQSSQNFLGS